MDMFITLFMVIISGIYAYVQTHWNIYITNVQFKNIYLVYLNKVNQMRDSTFKNVF